MTTTTEYAGHGDTDVADTDVAAPVIYGHFDGIPEQAGAVKCLCPFCGNFHSGVGRACSNCSLEDTDATRAATEKRLGNWFILQTNNPSAPGINLETLRRLIRQNIVTGRSVVRGPSTAQLWRLACKVRGLSREFGLCYNCAEKLDPTDTRCSHCERVQTLPEQSDAMTARFHKPPKDDLLTARDVAKAFNIDFGSTDVGELLKPARQSSGKPIRIAITAGVILMIGALAWPITSAVAGKPAPKASAVSSVGSPVTPTETPSIKPLDERLIASTESVVAPKPVDVPLPTQPVIVAAKIKPAEIEPTRIVAMVAPSPMVAANEPATVDNDNPVTLFNAGLDAESRGDFATAVKVYEQIESLPGSEWPSNLKTRLTLARAGLKGDLR